MSGSEDVEMMDAEVQFDHMGPSSTDGPASPSSTGATAGTSDGYESPASPSSNATTTGTSDDDYELPIPIAACLRVMSGRLAMGEDFYLLIPDAGFTLSRFRGHPAHPPRVLSKAKTPEQLEEARRFLYSTASAIPRFLFRGFNLKSGGGHHRRLNSRKGIVPHAFLKGVKPTSMWRIRKLYRNLTLHLKYVPFKYTNFSSWSQMLILALDFATNYDLSSTIAVLDIQGMVGRVWHSTDLRASGLCRYQSTQEYLIYGPINGPKYHCVSVDDLMSIPGARDVLCPVVTPPFKEAVDGAREVAKALQPQNASLDKILIITARLVGFQIAETVAEPMPKYFTYADIDKFLYYIRDDLQVLATRDDVRHISLAVPGMSTSHSPALVYEVQIQMAAENAMHTMGWIWRAGLTRVLRSPSEPTEV